MTRNRLMISILALLPSAALATQQGPVYVADPEPVVSTACNPRRVQIGVISGQQWCCVSGTWRQCSSNGSYLSGDASSSTAISSGSTTARSFASRFADVANVRDFGAKGDGTTDDTAAIQAALDAVNAAGGGTVLVPKGTYKVSSQLVLYGTMELRGVGPGASIIKLATPTSNVSVLVDSSLVTSSAVNSDITVRGIEIDGNSFTSGYATTGINMFRVKNLLIEDFYVHDVSGTAIAIFGSQADSTGITIKHGRTKNSGTDAIGIMGRDVLVEDVIAEDYKDTGFALLQDLANRSGTNPSTDYPHNVTFRKCRAKGYATGTPTGFAFGPFVNWSTLGDASITLDDVRTESNYIGAFAVALNGLTIKDSFFDVPRAQDTGNVRIDGVGNFSLRGSTLKSATGTPSNVYASPLFLQSARFTYGASNFDANTTGARIVGNRFEPTNSYPAVVVRFANTVSSPSFSSTFTDALFSDNVFANSDIAIAYRPDAGSPAASCVRVSYAGNKVIGGSSFLYFGGAANQYEQHSHALTNSTATSLTGGSPPPSLGTRASSPVSADRGDTSQTLTAGVDAQIQRWTTALSQDRTVTLSTTGAVNGDTFRVVRTGLGSFTLDVGGLKTIPSATAAFVDVTYDGSAWQLTGYGAL